ncbi:GMC oxidoreductase [Hydnum rufescens UP504]|uniref:GMC oxidoreductase n=1 Tax=Hydnum rufescens UP504 TaxID=1448309 RepID=A0A9P6DRT2_9AGAM|nr:GMC oxidoreductase [Hydnum rufescens UP504]
MINLLLVWVVLLREALSSFAAVVTNPVLASNRTFDYIILGGGLAGLTVANRLSENCTISVLVIEAGQDNRDDPRIYDIYQYGSTHGTSLEWSYPSNGGVIRGGRTLGGSSSVNGAIWTRGTKQQYDAWSQLLDPIDASVGWNWDGLLSYMKKAESFSAPTSQQRAKGADYVASCHGSRGPVNVAFPNLMYGGPQQSYFASVMVKFGLAKNPDLNGGTPNCVSFPPLSLNKNDGDHRSSSATAYLSPVESTRTNWMTLVGQQVTKIIFNPSTVHPRVATGVQFGTLSGARYTAFARREVIVAAGSIGSPKILQLSGIGDATALSSLGIASIVDLKTVGKNLQEQTINIMAANTTYFDVGGRGPSDAIAYPNIYQLFGTQANAMISHIQSSLPAWAASQAGSALSAGALRNIYTIQSNLIIAQNAPIAEVTFKTKNSGDKIGTNIWQLLPFSRGTVQISSSNPFDIPEIKVNFFAIDFDMATQIAAARFTRHAFQTAPLSTLSTGESLPGFTLVPDSPDHGSTANWTSWIMNNARPVAHPIATCAMMSRSLGGVVDAQLRVYDTKNVRVVDASIMPIQISAHLSSTVYGIAEKAADLIKNAQN